MEVLILSKTYYGRKFRCVGGIVLEDGRYVRLLRPGGWYQDPSTPFNIGDVWDLTFAPSDDVRPPHVEDVIVRRRKYLRKESGISAILEKLDVPVWKGEADTLFDGLLEWTYGGSGYIEEKTGIPMHSVGFWKPDRPLRRIVMLGLSHDGEAYTTVRYVYPSLKGERYLPYKGCCEPAEEISPGTIVRVSLAKWWDTHGTTTERCALQMSGWYGSPKN